VEAVVVELKGVGGHENVAALGVDSEGRELLGVGRNGAELSAGSRVHNNESIIVETDKSLPGRQNHNGASGVDGTALIASLVRDLGLARRVHGLWAREASVKHRMGMVTNFRLRV
jgi:hypothetical protein